MALTKLEANVNNIQALSDQVIGQASTLKQKFDKAGTDIKTYINGTLTVEIDAEFTQQAEDNADTYATKAEVQGIVLGQIPNGSLTEPKMANDMKKDIAGGVASYNVVVANITNNDAYKADKIFLDIMGVDYLG